MNEEEAWQHDLNMIIKHLRYDAEGHFVDTDAKEILMVLSEIDSLREENVKLRRSADVEVSQTIDFLKQFRCPDCQEPGVNSFSPRITPDYKETRGIHCNKCGSEWKAKAHQGDTEL